MTAAHDRSAGPQSGIAAAFVALCLGAVAMGVSPLLVRYAAEAGTGPFASAFWRVFLSLPILYAWMRIEERHQPPATARPPIDRATLLAGAAFAGDLFFWHLSILNTTVANATFFATTAPVFVVLITWAVLRKTVAGATLAGLALCLAGGGALIGHSLRLAPERLPGDLYGIATAFFFGLYFLAVKRARGSSGAARVTFLLSLVTAALLFAVALTLDSGLWPRTLAGALALVGLAWISHAGGQGLLAVALGRLPTDFSSLVIFLEALVAAALAWMLLGEALSAAQCAGGALILMGIWVARPRSGGEPSR